MSKVNKEQAIVTPSGEKAENEEVRRQGIVDVLVSIFSNYVWTATRITNAWSEIDSTKDKTFARITNVCPVFVFIAHVKGPNVSSGNRKCSWTDVEKGRNNPFQHFATKKWRLTTSCTRNIEPSS